MKATIDRIEDGICVLETEYGKMMEIPAYYLENFNEGDVLEISFTKDEKATAEKHNQTKNKLDGLFDN